MKSNFGFLENKFPALAKLGGLAEKYLYSDANSCLMKLGQIGETVVNLIYSYDKIKSPEGENAASRIVRLKNLGQIDTVLSEQLHALRRARNKAAHEIYNSENDGKILLQTAYGVCEWLMSVYGDASYKHSPFTLPQPGDFQQPDDQQNTIAALEAQIKKLTEQAQKAAASTPAAEKRERAERGRKAADQRVVSEEETRYLIDEQLRSVGWEVDSAVLRYSRGTRPQKGKNIAVAEWPTLPVAGKNDTCYVDYALFCGLRLVGFVEAKAEHRDISAVISGQCREYARAVRPEDQKYLQGGPWNGAQVPFIYAANGRPYLKQLEIKSGVWFHDLRESGNIPHALAGWHSPAVLTEMLRRSDEEAARRLEAEPWDILTDPDGLNLREYQLRAVKAVSSAVQNGRRHILLSMATGTGKTRVALAIIYRFLKAERFRRVLLLVDRNTLGEQALDTFNDVKVERRLSLPEIYGVKELAEQSPDPETRLQIATVQSMVRRVLMNDADHPMPSAGDYDLIVVDEAHRGYSPDREMTDDELAFRDQSDYQSKYRAVLDYFDAVKIGLTATPTLNSVEIFGEPEFEYSYREAVIDGALVDHDAPHRLTTALSTKGIHFAKGDDVQRLDAETGQLFIDPHIPDELDFSVEQFNKEVIAPDFNKVVLEEIFSSIDPENPSQGKTLIFAANNAHADLIVDILRKMYEPIQLDSGAIVKITSAAGDRDTVQQLVARFKNERFPSVAVTVDLLTTGIDVPSITRLVFLRAVRSRVLFEQMMGRATRRCETIGKDHFEIYDPIGVYDLLLPHSAMRPAVPSPQTTFSDLLKALEPDKLPPALTALDPQTAHTPQEQEAALSYRISLILAKLRRIHHRLSDEGKDIFRLRTDGLDLPAFVEQVKHLPPQQAKERLLSLKPLFEQLDGRTLRAHNHNGPAIYSGSDQLAAHERGYGNSNMPPEDYIKSFGEYLRTHLNEITALKILCTRPRDLTREDLKKLRLELSAEGFTTFQLNSALDQARAKNASLVADIITLIRSSAIGSPIQDHAQRIKNAVTRLKERHKFNLIQLRWLDRIEQYLVHESVFNRKTFDEDDRFKSAGGFARLNKQFFGGELEHIVDELNDYLYEDTTA